MAEDGQTPAGVSDDVNPEQNDEGNVDWKAQAEALQKLYEDSQQVVFDLKLNLTREEERNAALDRKINDLAAQLDRKCQEVLSLMGFIQSNSVATHEVQDVMASVGRHPLVENLLTDKSGLQKEIKQLEADKTKLQQELHISIMASELLKSEVKTYEKQVQEKERKVESKRAKVKELKNQLDNLKNQKTDADMQLVERSCDGRFLTMERERISDKLKTTSLMLEERGKLLQDALKQADNMEKEKYTMQLESIKGEYKMKEKAVEKETEARLLREQLEKAETTAEKYAKLLTQRYLPALTGSEEAECSTAPEPKKLDLNQLQKPIRVVIHQKGRRCSCQEAELREEDGNDFGVFIRSLFSHLNHPLVNELDLRSKKDCMEGLRMAGYSIYMIGKYGREHLISSFKDITSLLEGFPEGKRDSTFHVIHEEEMEIRLAELLKNQEKEFEMC